MNGTPVTRMEYIHNVLTIAYDPGDGGLHRLEFTGKLYISPAEIWRRSDITWDLDLQVIPEVTRGRWGRLTVTPPPSPYTFSHADPIGH